MAGGASSMTWLGSRPLEACPQPTRGRMATSCSNPELARHTGDCAQPLAAFGDCLVHHAAGSRMHLRRMAPLARAVRCCYGLLLVKG
jgi:hypothetical protein